MQPQANAIYAILPAAVPPASHHPKACLLPATMPCVGPLLLGPHGRPITAATQCNCCGNRQTALLRSFSGILTSLGKRFHLRLYFQSFCISAVGFQYVPFDIAIWPVLHHRTGRPGGLPSRSPLAIKAVAWRNDVAVPFPELRPGNLPKAIVPPQRQHGRLVNVIAFCQAAK